ncbi:response regulator transcription factor [Paenibacillus piri]|nr:response regulator [Paenibacillus piri]
MKLNVLIADDELLMRNRLRSMIAWEKMGYSLCGEASNGAEAERMIDELQPEIVILDIHMPLVDGVCIAKSLHDRRRFSKFIVLSSYDNFDYVRDTMSYGAIDYLLKHRLDPPTLLEALHKTRERIRLEAANHREKETAFKFRDMYSPMLTQKMIHDLILGIGQIKEEGYEHLKASFSPHLSRNMLLLVLQIDRIEAVAEKQSEEETASMIRTIHQLCKQAIGELRHGYVTYMDKGRFALLLSFADVKSEHAIFQTVFTFRQRLEQTLKMYLNLSAVIGQSGLFHALGEVASRYQSAVRQMYEVSGSALRIRLHDQPLPAMTIRQEKGLLASIDELDAPGMEQVVKSLFRSGALAGDDAQLHMLVNELMHIAVKVCARSGLEAGWIRSVWTSVLQMEPEPERVRDQLIATFARLIAQLEQSAGAKRVSKYVGEAIHYVKSNYNKNISLEETAGQIKISPAYLSKLFKDEMNVPFTEYLNQVRIEASRKLIEHGSFKVKDLFETVGFNNYSYFIKVFKEIVGMTPHIYSKKRNGRRSSS